MNNTWYDAATSKLTLPEEQKSTAAAAAVIWQALHRSEGEGQIACQRRAELQTPSLLRMPAGNLDIANAATRLF